MSAIELYLDFIFSGDSDGTLNCWYMEKEEYRNIEMAPTRGLGNAILNLKVNLDKKLLVAGFMDGWL